MQDDEEHPHVIVRTPTLPASIAQCNSLRQGNCPQQMSNNQLTPTVGFNTPLKWVKREHLLNTTVSAPVQSISVGQSPIDFPEDAEHATVQRHKQIAKSKPYKFQMPKISQALVDAVVIRESKEESDSVKITDKPSALPDGIGFDSDAENTLPEDIIGNFARRSICLANLHDVYAVNKKINYDSRWLIKLSDLIAKSIDNTKDIKLYSCKFCASVFNKRAALGGHMSKNHPNQSEGYSKRIECSKERLLKKQKKSEECE